MIKIILVDDHLMLMEGLQAVLEKHANFSVIGICTTSKQLKEILTQQNPDVILLDINLNSEENGISLCKEIKKNYPNIKVIAISMYSEKRYTREMLNSGASGYLIKNYSHNQIIEGINVVLSGQQYFLEEDSNPKKTTQSDIKLKVELTFKEKKILQLIQQGKTSKKISEILNCSVKTIEFYRSTLFIKFEVSNAFELIHKAQKNDLLP